MNQVPPASPDLDTLVGLFYANPDELGQLEMVTAGEMPPAHQTLLAHNAHMTVTVERFHASTVSVQVMQTRVSQSHYARKILLTRDSDGRVVQFGIVRLDFGYLEPAVQREIESEQTPLGRILIEHNVLRQVELVALWKVTPGEDLRKLCGLAPGQVIYGRTALIHCNGEPAVELLEIVTPD